jgi:hypothetical protein
MLVRLNQVFGRRANEVLSQCPTRASKENWAALVYPPDAFNAMRTNQNLIVKRIDSAHGWWVDLKFKCCISINLISISGLRFLSYSPTTSPSCYGLTSSTAVTASAGFSPVSGVLLLSLSTTATASSPTSAIVRAVAGFANMMPASSTSASVSAFNENGWPLQAPSELFSPKSYALASSLLYRQLLIRLRGI